MYDGLIEKIPWEYRVDETVRGRSWTMVRSGGRVGLAMNVPIETRPWTLPGPWEGMRLRELAEAAKSWNFAEAGLGVAAINAFYNFPDHPPVAKALEREDADAFTVWRDRAAGKKAAVIGRFPHLEKTLGEVCEQLLILEKRPVPGDYPDSACEFLLSRQDLVFATGVTVINKTLPRLLDISRKTGLILVGPSVPLAPRLFDFGVRDLQGFVVTDPAACRSAVSETSSGCGGRPCIFDAGQRVSLTRAGPV
ncbi:MAG: DUF364 domain-containing protein [Spirochaetaceae bacterium]|nr:DUF364 domain-containing protein [Spirochaetaceae bacterium]